MPLGVAGFVFRRENPERTKRYFREPPGVRRTHIHIRRAGSFSEQFALLFRDYLRRHPERADAYVTLKRDSPWSMQTTGGATSMQRARSSGRP